MKRFSGAEFIKVPDRAGLPGETPRVPHAPKNFTLAAGHSGGEPVYRHGAASAYPQAGRLEGAVEPWHIETGDREKKEDAD
ncbi:hypothetical protein SCOR_00310 [Sulfidibacter corallicola]